MTLIHRLRPAAAEPAGALVLLHGRGADQDDLYGLLGMLDPGARLLGVTPGAPLTGIAPGGRHWYRVPRVGYPDPETFAAAYAELTGFLDGLLGGYGIRWERTVIGGFSMGAVMSYAVALGPRRPAPAAVLAFSGFIPTVEGWEPDFAGREHLPVFITHGSQDPVIEVGFGRRAHATLQAAGLPVEYLETDVPHAIAPAAVERARDVVTAALS